MRVLALASILVTVGCTSDPGDTSSNLSSSSSSSSSDATPPTSDPIPETCTNGVVDPDERCDSEGLCDAWCQDGAFIFGSSMPGYGLTNDNFEIICNPGPSSSSRNYVPFFPMDEAALQPTPLMTGGYSTTCKLPAVEPAQWQSLVALADAQLGDLCGHHGQSLATSNRIWLSHCNDGHAMFREADGDVVMDTCSPFASDPTEAIVLCVAQP